MDEELRAGRGGVEHEDEAGAGLEHAQPGESTDAVAGAPDIEKLVQQAVDRATSKLGQDNRALRETIAKLERESMTSDERRRLELAEKEHALAAREAELLDRENRLYAVRALKAAGLDDGGEASLELVDLVLGQDEAGIDRNVAALAALVKARVQADVGRIFREGGGVPQKSGRAAPDNPWKTGNLTRQMELEVADPARAKALAEAAGGK